MIFSTSIDPAKIAQWIEGNFDIQKIQEELKSQGCDAEIIDAYLKEFKRVRNSKRQANGFICLGIGAFIGFISTVLALLNLFPGLFFLILYGLTSVAILLIFAGLYFLLE